MTQQLSFSTKIELFLQMLKCGALSEKKKRRLLSTFENQHTFLFFFSLSDSLFGEVIVASVENEKLRSVKKIESLV